MWGRCLADFRYKAFISYSWSDAVWGKWLHHSLETFRTPKGLIGQDGAHGPVPARLHPLFKDREEEAAGSSISDAVEKALAASEFLIVICSPRSARSQWVNKEVAWFKTHRDPAKILTLIVDGEPGSPDAECFPKALTHHVGPDLSITDERADAPLAADARDSGDGKRGARLKLAAAMLGVGLDGLVRRDERRRTVRTRIVVGASLALALVMSGLAYVAIQARDEAQRQRAEADGLIEFMLTDLREKLEPVGRLDALDVVGKRALAYYARQKLTSLDADELGHRAKALLLVGEISNLRGNSAEALKAFQQAAGTTKEQLARDPGNGQRIYDHAQSVFWVGAIAYERKEIETAEREFREYKRLADRLLALDPNRAEWQMESSYAETNLGVMLKEQRRFEEAEPAFARALARIEKVAAGEAYDPGRQVEIGQIMDWLGIVTGELGKEREALELHQREVAIYDRLLQRDPANASAKNRLAIALQFVGAQQLDLGRLPEAIAAYDRSLAINGELRALEGANTEWQETAVRAQLSQAEQLIYAGRNDQSGDVLARADALLSRLVLSDPENDTWSGELRFTLAEVGMMLALERGDLAAAGKRSREIFALLDRLSETMRSIRAVTAHRLRGDLHQRSGQREEALQSWITALGMLPAEGQDLERVLLLRRLGKSQEAAAIKAVLDRRGYRHPAYLAVR